MFVIYAERLAALEESIADLNIDRACEIAAGLQYVGILDALKLVRAMAISRDRRFERAATRWIVRLREEAGASLDELQLATAAFAVLARTPESEDAWVTLTSIVRAKD